MDIQENASEINYLKTKLSILEKTVEQLTEESKSRHVKSTTNFNQPLVTLGSRLQKINPETLSLIRVYECVNECLKESNFEMKRPSIMKAIKERTM